MTGSKILEVINMKCEEGVKKFLEVKKKVTESENWKGRFWV